MKRLYSNLIWLYNEQLEVLKQSNINILVMQEGVSEPIAIIPASELVEKEIVHGVKIRIVHRLRKPISVTLPPELYARAKAKGLNLSALMDQAIEQELNKGEIVEEIIKPVVHDQSLIKKKEEQPKKSVSKALYECVFCGLRHEGQYHITNGIAYCNTCSKQLSTSSISIA